MYGGSKRLYAFCAERVGGGTFDSLGVPPDAAGCSGGTHDSSRAVHLVGYLHHMLLIAAQVWRNLVSLGGGRPHYNGFRVKIPVVCSFSARLNVVVLGSFLPHCIMGYFRVACSVVRMLYLVLAAMITGTNNL